MKTKTIMTVIILGAGTVQAAQYDTNALNLSNRILGCGALASDIVKNGYKLIRADETSVAQDERAMPIITQGVINATFGKDYRPMQGYTAITSLEIKFTKTCFGSPAAGGKCTEVVETCEQK